MKKSSLILCLGAVAATGAARPPSQPAQTHSKPPKLEWHGAFSSVAKPHSLIVADAAAWKSLWAKDIGSGAPPSVDFKKYVAAAVFLGQKLTGGYDVLFSTVPAPGKRGIVIGYREKKPSRGAFVIESLTRPYAIRLYSKPRGRASIRKLP
jgi:hypothetical protein